MEAGADNSLCIGVLLEGGGARREQFVDRTYVDLFRWFNWLTNDRDDSSDLTQSTFVAFWDSLESAERSTNGRVWLFAVGRNVWRNWCRESKRRRSLWKRELASKQLPQASEGDVGVAAAVSSECAAAVREAVANLPANLREVVTLRYWQGSSYNEISEILGISPELARKRAFEGRNVLRRQLSAWAPGGED